MKNKNRYGLAAVLVAAGILIGGPRVFSAETSVSKEYAPLEWNYQGGTVPETYWTPYFPVGVQELTRYRFGFRFSTGTIAVKAPVKLTFKYDPANAQSGRDLAVSVKAELMSAADNTFESAFGLYLPSEFQIGFFGITAVPDLLPWYTLPWDMCEILGKVPGLPDAVTNKVDVICRAIENFGVNMNTRDALPLGGEASYRDTRTILDMKFTDFFTENQKTAFLQNLGIVFFNRISGRLGPLGMENLLLVVRAAKGLDEAGATEFLTDLCIDAAGRFMDALTVTAVGDPYFKVKGVDLAVTLRAYIPGGKGSGTYPLLFTSSGEEKVMVFRDINPFVQTGDKLVIVPDRIAYRFKLIQGMSSSMKFSVFPAVPIGPDETYVDLPTAGRDYGEGENKIEIPLTPSTDIIQGLRVQPGCTSMGVNWTSPAVALKGTVKVYDGTALVKTVTESGFKNAHNVIVPGLAQGKNYRFAVDCVSEKGQQVPAGEISGSTRTNDCPVRIETATDSGLVLSNPSAEAGIDWIRFSWTTNRPASTEVFVSPSSDISVNYVASIKKQSGEVVTGWADRGGSREFVTAHSIRVTGLEPNTPYYYNLRSWTFQDNDETKQDTGKVGHVGQITTQSPPFVRVKVSHHEGKPVADMPVEVLKAGAASPVTYITQADGLTPPVYQEAGQTYHYSVKNQGCYPDASAQPQTVPANAAGQWASPQITLLDHAPKGAYVYDAAGRPVAGVAVTAANKQATTDADGYYRFGTWLPDGSVSISVRKDGYITKQIQGRVDACGKSRTFTIPDCILQSGVAALRIAVKNKNGGGIGGTAIVIKEGNTVRANLTADGQGRAVWTRDYGENTQDHALTVTATPPVSTGLAPSEVPVSITGGGEQDAELVCLPRPPVDNQAPVISGLGFSQFNTATIEVSFQSGENLLSAALEYQKPGAAKPAVSPWVSGAGLRGSKDAGYGLSLHESGLPAGLYKIRVRAKDPSGNEGQSGFQNFQLFGGTLWNLHGAGESNGTSLTLTWNKYPRPGEFGKYVLIPGAGAGTAGAHSSGHATSYDADQVGPPAAGAAPVEITDINVTTHTLSQLVPGKTYPFKITAVSKTGNLLAESPVSRISLASGAPPSPQPAGPANDTQKQYPDAAVPEKPVIRGFLLKPETRRAGEKITVSARITDPDSPVKKITLKAICAQTKEERILAKRQPGKKSVIFNHSFVLEEAGGYTLVLEAADEAATVEEMIECRVEPAPEVSGKDGISKDGGEEPIKPAKKISDKVKKGKQKLPAALKTGDDKPHE